jgi:hypothetical protein
MIAQLTPINAHNGKFDRTKFVLSKHEQRMRVFDLTVALLIARAGMADYWAEGFQDARNLLAAMSLPKVEFTSASWNLQNAIGYCQREEFGAAAFELRALRGQLQRL